MIKYMKKLCYKKIDIYNNKNDLIYKGEYNKGKILNGKIKEYYNGELIFEGEYKEGKRNGKVKEYNYNGELIFEGEYKEGERNGNFFIFSFKI